MRKHLLLLAATAAFLGAVLTSPVQSQRGAQPIQLPDGPGKEMVTATCTRCHGLNFITNADGYTRDEWQFLFSSMVALPKDQADAISGYLATHFPEKPTAHKAKIIPGPVQVTIKEWMAPTLGQRPHDPLAARDGSIWWTGQYDSRLGRVDPRTGAIKEFPLKTPNSGPHGIVEDKDGNIWYTAINVQKIGKLNPKTGEITEYPMPVPEARGPHTPIFDQKGRLFFTLQSGHVGRLDPATGQIKISKTPSDNTYPYGIQVNTKGVPWYVDFRGPRLGSVNPETLEITEYTLPNAESRPRRIALTPDDAVWYADYSRGYLGRYDPKTGKVEEWLSPGGAGSEPYGIATVGDIVWYSESNVKPNTLVRFDSKAKTFQTWAIPSGGVVIRNMMATANGNLVMACSGVNRVALVEVGNTRTAGTR